MSDNKIEVMVESSTASELNIPRTVSSSVEASNLIQRINESGKATAYMDGDRLVVETVLHG